ncbi:MAG: fumarylacetoacetate hydrolase family protein [Bacteroidales bacterium]|jgi:2-keto-4-pentenoate hydratase/2-oxohepta-3-ene-1,7-dioic acid hydratase in catechol pathway|nr:fumarylacetoacetate hydrolase family protein [Bacteroidales bacterium]
MKIFCVGRNYRDHIKELGGETSEEFVFFMKPETALLQRNRPFYIPPWTNDLQYETELVLKICKNGKYIQEKFAPNYYNEIGIGIDFTARDLQNQLISRGLPWEKCKGFDFSAPIGQFLPKKQLDLEKGINFSLKINDELRQSGNSRDMIHSFDKIISEISKFITLKIGDLIYTGTPAGVEKVQIGDRLEASIENQPLLSVAIK